MRRHVLRALLIVALVLVVGTLSVGDRAQVAAESAMVTSMYGDVQVRHGTAGYAAARLNEVLKPGDAIKTGADSRAELSVAGGGYVRMDESSQLLITYIRSGGTTSFQALVGGIWVTLEQALTGGSKFEVRMPSAVASVKGTVFRCEVSEDGESATYVYDGEVELTAGEETMRVQPNEVARVPRGVKIALERMNLAFDDEKPWVTYNRHRDIIRHLGNPSIMVALREKGIETGRGVYLASAALTAELRRNGLIGASVTPADEARFTIGPDGLVRWRRHPEEDYCVVGVVKLDQVRRLRENLFTARATGRALLVEDGDAEAIVSVEALLSGVGDSRPAAVADALKNLGVRLGQEMAPRILKELMQQRRGTTRVDISGGSREQIGQLRRLISDLDGVVNTTPLRLPGDRISLAVAGGVSAGELEQAIRDRGGDGVEMVRSWDNVVVVRFKGGANQDVYLPGPPNQPGLARRTGNPNDPRAHHDEN